MKVGSQSMSGITWRATNLTLSDFAVHDSVDDTQVSASDQPTEWAWAEIGEPNGVDSQLSSYDFLRLGRSLGATGNSGRGKLRGSFADGETDLPDDTEIRFVLRPRNSDGYIWTGTWMEAGDIERDDTRQRLEFPPKVDADGDPLVFRDGRVLAIEVRNSGQNFTVTKADSQFNIPAQAGY